VQGIETEATNEERLPVGRIMARFRSSDSQSGVCGALCSDPWVGDSNPSSTDYFHIIVYQPSASRDHWRSALWTIQFVACRSSLSYIAILQERRLE